MHLKSKPSYGQCLSDAARFCCSHACDPCEVVFSEQNCWRRGSARPAGLSLPWWPAGLSAPDSSVCSGIGDASKRA